MRTRWRPRAANRADRTEPDPALADALGRHLGLHPLIGRLLVARDITDPGAAHAFLHPSLNDLHDPAHLPGCTAAAERLAAAVQRGQRIVVYGDYDVDGVTASTILWHTLRAVGADVHTYIPHRIDEGYGLNTEAITAIAKGELPTPDDEGDAGQAIPSTSKDSPPLIISVDCGITATEPARAARELGVDLIITDHHQFDPDNLPEAHTLVHPRLHEAQRRDEAEERGEKRVESGADPDSPLSTLHAPQPHLAGCASQRPYPFPDLCGAGVAFKLAWQFAKTWCGSERVSEEFRTLLTDLLSLVALGTVADVVPLRDENRVLTIFGLGRIKQTRFAGLNALIDAARLRDEKIDAYHVGFVLGPCLNACGRMGHARRAVRLLTTATGNEARELADFLTHENERRRATERAIFTEAEQLVREHGFDSEDARAIVVGKSNWHPGVIGIVASRLAERFARPVVMLNLDNGTAHGSARSVEGISIYEAFDACRAHLTHFGGHAMAAGLKLPTDNVEPFRAALIDYANQRLDPADLVGTLELDADVELATCSVDLFQQIQRLAPFGRGNPEPRLALRAATLDAAPRRVGKEGTHLALELRAGACRGRAIGFGMGDLADQLACGQTVDLAFEPRLNTWRGETRPELRLCDLKRV
ncbi:MAG: single-stranded-DNA-specific exonuclease RecJ [Phycisphaeraceae bacterium]